MIVACLLRGDDRDAGLVLGNGFGDEAIHEAQSHEMAGRRD